MTEQKRKDPKPSAAWLPPKWSDAEVIAFQRLIAGEASSEQQVLVIRCIVEKICGTYDLPYRPESSRDTDFACGRMFVGQQIVKLTKINLSTFKEK